MMDKKSDLRAFLKTVLETLPIGKNQRPDLQKGRMNLQNRYAAFGKTDFQNDTERLAYVRYRLPATLTVMTEVLDQLEKRIPHPPIIGHHLDLGSGPGTVSLALWARGWHPKSATLVEHDPAISKLSAHLLAANTQTFFHHNPHFSARQSYDMVTASYALSEWTPSDRGALLTALWPQVSGYFVVVEPGTPQGFQVIQEVRAWILKAGGSVIAPCPHPKPCPMVGGDWCHFSKRVMRDDLHQSLKKGTLPYEDEKFSYAIFAAGGTALSNPESPVIKKPIRASGHVMLDVCAEKGTLERRIVSTRQKDMYKAAKKTKWGDTWPF